MCVRQVVKLLAVGMMAWTGLASTAVGAQDYEVYPLEARVWLDRGAEPLLQRGERSRIYYRVSESAFVAIFHIDTNGTVRMVFPSSPQENHYARGGRDYRVLFSGSSYWYVNDDPGMGYFFIVASPEPFDFREFGYSHFAGGWDLSRIGRQIYGDPYLAMDDFVDSLIPDWEYVGYGLDFTSYNVERHHDYPRFLCYDCHGFQPYYNWNPYGYSCTSFRVVIYNDPYYYPVTRYRGTRVVYVQPRRGVAHFGFKERATGESGVPQVVVRNTPPVNQPGAEANGNRRAVPRVGAPSAFSPSATPGNSPEVGARTRPGVEGSANRRSSPTGTSGSSTSPRGSGALPGSTPSPARVPSTIRTDPRSPRSSGTTQRPVLERRPTGSSAAPPGGTRTPPTRPSVKVRKPGSGGGGSAARSVPSTQSSGSAVRSVPSTRTSGSAARSVPSTRNSGAATRSVPSTRTSGATPQRVPTVRPGGSANKTPPRTVRTQAKPKPKKPRGGGGGGG